jgi:hypothetical protein
MMAGCRNVNGLRADAEREDAMIVVRDEVGTAPAKTPGRYSR